jgi:hypothetical protein
MNCCSVLLGKSLANLANVVVQWSFFKNFVWKPKLYIEALNIAIPFPIYYPSRSEIRLNNESVFLQRNILIVC